MDLIETKAVLRALQSVLESINVVLDESKIELCDFKSNLRELKMALVQMSECKCTKQCVHVETKRQEGDETPLPQKPREF